MRQESNHRQVTATAARRAPRTLAPSLANARNILRTAVRCGNVSWTNRFVHRCKLHVINTVDVVRVICCGTLVSGNRFDAANNGWRYQLVGQAEGRKLKVEVLLDCQHDFDESPFLVVITACWCRGRVKELRE